MESHQQSDENIRKGCEKCGTKKNNNHSGITTPIRSTAMTTGNVCLLLRFYIQKIVNKYNIFEQKQNINRILHIFTKINIRYGLSLLKKSFLTRIYK